MPSLKDLRNRIDSVKSTKKITQAMKMVAASKLKKAQTIAEKGRNYSAGIEDIVKKLSYRRRLFRTSSNWCFYKKTLNKV